VKAELRTVHTADLAPGDLTAIRTLLDGAFDDMTDEALDNCLGGIHVLIHEGSELIGHASVVQRRMMHGGRALRAGYIEGVAVRKDRRRLGHGDALMAALEHVVRNGYQLGALGASPDGARLYTSRGWQLWLGPSSAFTPDGIRRTEDKDGCIHVLELAEPLDLAGELVCDWRPGLLW
jgi:aminoglycoside 2'-N-acetyltransferase I